MIELPNNHSNNHYTILLLEEDDEARGLLVENLQRYGYAVIMTLTEADAIARAKYEPSSIHLILLNQVEQSPEAYLEMGRRIRQQGGLPANTPIVVIADQFEPALDGQDQAIDDNAYISYPADAQQIFDLLARLCRR